MNRTEELVYWITEREAMRVRRNSGKYQNLWRYGWSDDVFMGTVRYCNVRREDDKVTQWLAQHWRPDHHAVWEIVLARMVNYIPTLEVLLAILNANHPDPLQRVAVHMKGARADGQKIWTSAYTISTCGKSMDKVDYVIGVVSTVRTMEETNLLCDFDSLKGAYEGMLAVDGLGSFLTAQVLADLKNTVGHLLQKAPDWWTWAAHGPGSLNGLSCYFRKKITPSGFAAALDQCWKEVKPHLDAELRLLHMQDFQNCMCEFSKFIRIKEGGHARNKYTTV